jgi:hypothetical protein
VEAAQSPSVTAKRLTVERKTGGDATRSDIEEAARSEVARIGAGVASDPGPPPHFPILIYEPESIPKSHDICDSNPRCAFATSDAIRFGIRGLAEARIAAFAIKARSFGLVMGGI